MNAYEIALGIYRTFGRSAAKAFLTPSRKFVERTCAKTGADPVAAMEERNEAVDEVLEFLESMLDADFEDPDEA